MGFLNDSSIMAGEVEGLPWGNVYRFWPVEWLCMFYFEVDILPSQFFYARPLTHFLTKNKLRIAILRQVGLRRVTCNWRHLSWVAWSWSYPLPRPVIFGTRHHNLRRKSLENISLGQGHLKVNISASYPYAGTFPGWDLCRPKDVPYAHIGRPNYFPK